MTKKIIGLLTILGCLFSINSQVVNGYATVTAIAGNTYTLSFVDEAGDTFEDGESIIIMQMQDDVIGGNTGNNSNFGDLATIASTGLYEVREILSHTEVSGIPTTITLNTATTNTYNIGVNSTVQVITFPTFGSPNYTTTSNMEARAWNGNNGGVLAFNVDGNLTLGHNLSADNAGFRGGAVSTNYYSGGSGCTPTGNFIRTSTHTRAGAKGEGIYKTANINFLYAKGKLLNGGGGGAERINSGGGGGGNYTTGGLGGFGWSCTTSPGGAGVGGLSLSTHISASRIFMGGGGGGGQQNNSGSTAGTNGGGIIIIKADTLKTTGPCAGAVSITANANDVGNGTNDGQGGGGAGGSIVLEVNGWDVAAACPIEVEANGGRGGNVISSLHAGGGGGGQGVIIYAIALPTTNTTTTTNNGAAGCSDTGCTFVAGTPSGTNGNGIIASTTGPLPIELLYFEAITNNQRTVDIFWETATETNNDYFIVEKSADAIDWTALNQVKGAGNSSSNQKYQSVDYNPYNGVSYYRLKQVDFDGSMTYSLPKSVNIEGKNNATLFPNPATGFLIIQHDNLQSNLPLVFNATGQLIKNQPDLLSATENQATLNTENLSPGVYFIKIGNDSYRFVKQ